MKKVGWIPRDGTLEDAEHTEGTVKGGEQGGNKGGMNKEIIWTVLVHYYYTSYNWYDE